MESDDESDFDEHYTYRINPDKFFSLDREIRNSMLDDVWKHDDSMFPDSIFRIDPDWIDHEFAGLGFTDLFDGYNDYHNEECELIDAEIKACIINNGRDWSKVAKIMYFFGVQVYDFGFVQDVYTLVDFIEVFPYGCFYPYQNLQSNHVLNRWCTGCFDIEFVLTILSYGELKEYDSDDEEFTNDETGRPIRNNFPWRVSESMCRGLNEIGFSSSNLFVLITILGRIYRDWQTIDSENPDPITKKHLSRIDHRILANRIPQFFQQLSQVKTIPDGGPYDRIVYHYFADTHYQYVECGLPLVRPRWVNSRVTEYCNDTFREAYLCTRSILANDFGLFPMFADPFDKIMAHVFDYEIDRMYRSSALYEDEIDAIVSMDEDAKIKLYIGYGVCPDVEEIMDYRIDLNGEEQDDTELKFGFNNERIVADDVLRMSKGLRVEQCRLNVYKKVLLANMISWEKMSYLILCITAFVGEREMPFTTDEICNSILGYMASNGIKLEDVYYGEYEFSITDAFQIAKMLRS